jgi:hypothetical protein
MLLLGKFNNMLCCVLFACTQASFYMQHQMQSIAQLDETDRQIRGEKMSSEYLKRLKEARSVYREDLIDCVRQCTWYVGGFLRKYLVLSSACGPCFAPSLLVCQRVDFVDKRIWCVFVYSVLLTSVSFGVQVPCDVVCEMEAEGNVCHFHVACAAIVGSEQE